MLVWLWCRLAATAPIQPLAWELAYAEGAALKRKKKKKEREKDMSKYVWPVTAGHLLYGPFLWLSQSGPVQMGRK